jgi:hypothetical protein
MEYHTQSRGWGTLLEHWGFLLVVLGVWVGSKVMLFFFNLHGEPWILLCAVSMGLQVTGAAMIVGAKLPAYRAGRFFAFGVGSVPGSFARHYLWGRRLFLLGVALSLGLLLSRN